MTVAPLADVSDRERRNGPPELVIRRKHPVVAMPVLPRRRDEIGEPVRGLIETRATGRNWNGSSPGPGRFRNAASDWIPSPSHLITCRTTIKFRSGVLRESPEGEVANPSSRFGVSDRSRFSPLEPHGLGSAEIPAVRPLLP